jgi:hypothetical protein
MMLLLALLLPLDLRTIHHADSCELNHYYDGEGREVLRQVILWDAHPKAPCVVAWWLVNQCHLDAPNHRVLDREHREFRFHTFTETWTQHDPELANREFWPVDGRRFPKGW